MSMSWVYIALKIVQVLFSLLSNVNCQVDTEFTYNHTQLCIVSV